MVCNKINFKESSLSFLIIILLLFGVLACESEFDIEGACEIKSSITDFYRYSCNDEDKGYCNMIDSDNRELAFHKGQSCADLGYNYYDGVGWIVEEGNSDTPGPFGAFADDINTPSGVNCDEYEGPEGDPQWDTLCKAAYQYTCANNQEAVRATCQNYRGLQETFPGIPDCPYCN